MVMFSSLILSTLVGRQVPTEVGEEENTTISTEHNYVNFICVYRNKKKTSPHAIDICGYGNMCVTLLTHISVYTCIPLGMCYNDNIGIAGFQS